MNSPRPCLLRVTEDVFPCEQSSHPHRPAAAAASSRPLQRGRAVRGDSPDTVPGCGDGISVRVIASTAERLYSSLAVCLWDIAPGEGLTGRGVEHPLPCRSCLLWRCFNLWVHPRLPAARAASSRPLPRGRAVHGDSPGTVPGDRDGISVRVIASTAERLYSSLALYRWDIAPWGWG
jgi:hypothetical protein